MGLARGVHRVLLPYSLVLHEEIDALELRYRVLAMSCAWGSERTLFSGAAALVARIPIAQAEYDAFVEEQRAEYVRIKEAVETVVLYRNLDESPPVERAVLRELKEAVEIGSLYEWVGEHYEAFLSWGRYEPVRDDEYEGLRWRREGMERQVAQLECGPSAPWACYP